MSLEGILDGYEAILRFIAEITVHTLELIGISIIIFGSVKALTTVLTKVFNKSKPTRNTMIDLGHTLALALEFKMGAEIVNTVIIHDLRELGILAIVIALRTILAILIHWEIKVEQNRCINEVTEQLQKAEVINPEEIKGKIGGPKED